MKKSLTELFYTHDRVPPQFLLLDKVLPDKYLKLLGCLVANPSNALDSFAPQSATIEDHKALWAQIQESDVHQELRRAQGQGSFAALDKVFKADGSSSAADERTFSTKTVTTIMLENPDLLLPKVYEEHRQEIQRQSKCKKDNLYFVVGLKIFKNAKYCSTSGFAIAKSFQAQLPITEAAASAAGLPPTASTSIGDLSTEWKKSRIADLLQSGEISGQTVFALRCIEVRGLGKARKDQTRSPHLGRQYRAPKTQTTFSGGSQYYSPTAAAGEDDDEDDKDNESVETLSLGKEYHIPERMLIA